MAVTPSGLVVQGEPGIGKTTLWHAAVAMARDRGYRVLSTRGTQAETVMSYSSLADLLADADDATLTALPAPQCSALQRVLSQPSDGEARSDQRAVAAGFLSLLEAMADAVPIVLSIDDLQWVDPSSALVIAYAARRLSGAVGVLATERTEPATFGEAWLELPRPDALAVIELGPLSPRELQDVLTSRLQRSFSRPAITRIHDISGGNPFYAIELARASAGDADRWALPGTLGDLVNARIARLDSDVYDVLLAASCSAAPNLERVAAAAGLDVQRACQLLEDAEAAGIVTLEGQRVCFTHSLLAWGVYTSGGADRRRAIHSRLAAIELQPELAARHLALGAGRSDRRTLVALDAAAESARTRGAPSAAAELVELAIERGGNTAPRRIAGAAHHFDAGNTGRARELLEATIDDLGPGPLRAEALHQLAILHMADESFLQAADCFEQALDEVGGNLTLRVQVLTTLSWVQLQAGPLDEAVRRCEEAVEHAECLGNSYVLGQVLSFRTVLYFIRGDGLDAASMKRALALADGDAYSLITINPWMQHALLLSWTGELDRAHQVMTGLKRDCIERGGESELIFVTFHSMLLEMWRGNLTGAAFEADDMMQRAEQLDGNISRSVALAMQTAMSAFAGQVEDARRFAAEGLDIGGRSGAKLVVLWQLTFLGFLEVSLRNYRAAADVLGFLVGIIDVNPNATETVLGFFLPDAAEALIHVGQIERARTIVDALERNGRRLDRAWMLAVSGRCRGMLLAADGDVASAVIAVGDALTEHDRVPMPFERARTELLLAELRSRLGLKNLAATALESARTTFDTLGAPLWSARAREVVPHLANEAPGKEILTPAERRIAELAASGMTNREIAAKLFISAKTVEANLARAYRKLAIRSRAQLGRRLQQAP